MDLLKLSPSFSSISKTTSFKTTQGSKLDYLYEIEYLLEDSSVSPSHFPVINPYQVYYKPHSSFKRKIKKLIGTKHHSSIKKYVQASNFSEHPIQADEQEQFLPILLPEELLP